MAKKTSNDGRNPKTDEAVVETADVTSAKLYRAKHEKSFQSIELRGANQVITHDGAVYQLVDTEKGEVLVASRSGRATFDKILKDNKL